MITRDDILNPDFLDRHKLYSKTFMDAEIVFLPSNDFEHVLEKISFYPTHKGNNTNVITMAGIVIIKEEKL